MRQAAPMASEHRPDLASADNSITQNLTSVHSDLHRAEQDGKRPVGATQLIAVSKTKPAEVIEQAIDAGQRLFGENRVQEAQAKFPDIKARRPEIAGALKLHLIGPLQSNKAKDAVALFDVIHTVDRPKIITALARAEQELGVKRRYFLQVNTGEEPQKAGVAPKDIDTTLAFAAQAGLNITGLMCIPPAEDPAAPHFGFLKMRADDLGLAELSMGMSGDYAIAAELGATYVRVGSALFGARAALAE